MPKKKENIQTAIVCTCRVENYGWIRDRRLYNLPLPKDGKGESYAPITHIAVYALDLPVLAYTAKYVREVDGAWLAANGYKASPKPHGEKYALFELGRAVAEASLYGKADTDVFVCSTRWTGTIDADFFARPLPQCGGKSVPNIFERIRPFFPKLHSARAFNPVQMDFFGLLGLQLDVPFPPVEHPRFTFIDLFAGVGGFRLAMQEYGGKCVFSSEWDTAAQETYLRNYGERPCGDITKDSTKAAIPRRFDVLCAGFPCQPFSLAGVSARVSLNKKHGFADKTQGTLFFDIIQIVRTHHPKVLFLENVRNLVNHDGGRTFRVIKEAIEHEGYSFNYSVIDASPLVPQKRVRCYMVCVRGRGKFSFPKIEGPEKKLSAILEESPSDSFTLSDKLWAGHKRRTCANLARGTGFTAFTADIDKPAHTLVARYYKDGKECLIPQKGKNPRMLTPRECARLQGFPEAFLLPSSKSKAYKQMGNSVAVPVLEVIAGQICNQVLKIEAEETK